MVDPFFLDEISSILCFIWSETNWYQLLVCRTDIWLHYFQEIFLFFFRLKFRIRSCRCGYLIRFHLEQLQSQSTVYLCVCVCVLFNRINEIFQVRFTVSFNIAIQLTDYIIVSFNAFKDSTNRKMFLSQSIEWIERTTTDDLIFIIYFVCFACSVSIEQQNLCSFFYDSFSVFFFCVLWTQSYTLTSHVCTFLESDHWIKYYYLLFAVRLKTINSIFFSQFQGGGVNSLNLLASSENQRH